MRLKRGPGAIQFTAALRCFAGCTGDAGDAGAVPDK